MSLDFPTSRSSEVQKIQTDIKNELPESNPNIRNNFFFALASGIGSRFFDVFETLKKMLDSFFIQTTFGIFLEARAADYGLTRNPATISQGPITVTGTASTIVPLGTLFRNSEGQQYETQSSVTIQNQVLSVTSLTLSSGVVTAVTSSDNNLATGMTVTIAGAVETDYNGSFVIQVTDTDTFTYSISTSPSSPATGTITVTADFISVDVESVDFGAIQNLESGEQLTLITPIAGVDNTAYVQFEGIGGGADLQTDEELRQDLLFLIQNPIALFSEASIIVQANKVSTVDRVFVFSVTPVIGQVTTYFTKRGDDIIPNPTEVAQVKAEIVKILPADKSSDDVIVEAPTLVTTDFTFTSITPDNTSMRTAIEETLENFFNTEVTVSVDVKQIAYNSAILDARDENGNKLTDFTLSAPSADITIATGELAGLGNVIFP